MEMTNKTLDEVAASIAQLHSCEFGDKSFGNYLLSPEDFRNLAGRHRIEKSIFNRVADILREQHGMLLVQGHDYYAVIDEARVLLLRQATPKVLRSATRMAIAPSPSRKKIPLDPAAAWPFPTSSRP
jgi:hypothetical protein